MLCDTTSFAGSHFGATDEVEQRCFTVVDVAHDRDNRCTGNGVCMVHQCFFFGEGLRVIQGSDDRFVTHFFYQDHGSVLV